MPPSFSPAAAIPPSRSKLPGAAGPPVPTLLVKGSGTDLRSVGRSGFSRLSLAALGGLREVPSMTDQEMMRFMADCMIGREGPAPSVETPLHSLLPHRVIAHTHDVATMSLTNLDDGLAERLVGEVFEGEIVYVPVRAARLPAGPRRRADRRPDSRGSPRAGAGASRPRGLGRRCRGVLLADCFGRWGRWRPTSRRSGAVGLSWVHPGSKCRHPNSVGAPPMPYSRRSAAPSARPTG